MSLSKGVACIIFTILLISPALLPQAPPGMDIYLAELQGQDGKWTIGEPRNITDRPGYDNQPFFTSDGRAILYSSIREDNQTDTYRYDLESGESTRVTATPESEFSPTVLPSGKGFSCVRVEMDSVQRLWRFDDRGGNPQVILEDVRPVGYHAWGDDRTVALFVLGEPHFLQIADTRSGKATTVARDIGRSLHRIPGKKAFSFMHHEGDEVWWIKSVQFKSHEIKRLIRVAPLSHDYTWTPSGAIWRTMGNQILRWHPRRDAGWVEIHRFELPDLQELTRIVVHPDMKWVAVVAAEKADE